MAHYSATKTMQLGIARSLVEPTQQEQEGDSEFPFPAQRVRKASRNVSRTCTWSSRLQKNSIVAQ